MSALVAFMSSFVIGYAIRFMLGRRKKEFATYELIGMEAKTVRNLFLAENSIIGTGAFLLGSLVGTGLSGLLNQVVKNIFEVPHTYQVSFLNTGDSILPSDVTKNLWDWWKMNPIDLLSNLPTEDKGFQLNMSNVDLSFPSIKNKNDVQEFVQSLVNFAYQTAYKRG